MNTIIVTDSSISLPQKLVSSLPLHVVPLEIHHENNVYLDGLDLSPDDFYRIQSTAKVPPRTSAPTPGAFLQAFQQASDEASSVICLTMSSVLSATHSAAVAAQTEISASSRNLTIEVIDSRTAGPALGLLALAAARMANTGRDLPDTLQSIRIWQSSIRFYGYLQSLYYLWRSGRVPRTFMWLNKLLDIKPLLQLTDGNIGMLERPRTNRRASHRLVTLAEQWAQGESTTIAITHTDAPRSAEILAEKVEIAIKPSEIFITECTPVIGAHTGPGLVGLAIHRNTSMVPA